MNFYKQISECVDIVQSSETDLWFQAVYIKLTGLELIGPWEEVTNKGQERNLLFVFIKSMYKLLITQHYRETREKDESQSSHYMKFNCLSGDCSSSSQHGEEVGCWIQIWQRQPTHDPHPGVLLVDYLVTVWSLLQKKIKKIVHGKLTRRATSTAHSSTVVMAAIQKSHQI